MKRLLLAACVAAGLSATVDAGVVRPGFTGGSLGRTDDGSSALQSLGFSNAISFGGNSYSSLYVNNNGNVTFDAALSAFTPFGLASLNRAVIAPFFADVDTRGALSGVATFGSGLVGGHQAFGITWQDVGYYRQKTDPLNSFQLVLINRADTGPGNFDIEFNYDKIQWEAGDASGGTNGLGGTTAGVGYADSSGALAFQLPGSGVNGSFLDSSPTGLIHSSNVGVDGRFLYTVRSGLVAGPTEPTPPIPEPATTAFGLALLGVCASGRFRTRRA